MELETEMHRGRPLELGLTNGVFRGTCILRLSSLHIDVHLKPHHHALSLPVEWFWKEFPDHSQLDRSRRAPVLTLNT